MALIMQTEFIQSHIFHRRASMATTFCSLFCSEFTQNGVINNLFKTGKQNASYIPSTHILSVIVSVGCLVSSSFSYKIAPTVSNNGCARLIYVCVCDVCLLLANICHDESFYFRLQLKIISQWLFGKCQ